MYFNWQGSIRVPAPIQLAHKLAYYIGEKMTRPSPIIPTWETKCGLYFL